ncbi:MAG: DUF488 domain-containing protein [Armatimonadota bacterium]|nr:DUF488 domain-containing protein [Armatimonadota bacterium]MDR7444468.1 DUF488 domain-containing protein [Armatimonadota bacterium]MDR7570170.1 DUF488 domain-containing protein [Armatimonadota bacterium]MDR7615227.1 DUF488 domain-containing protein [Armatimonadota bacterium]
MARSAACERPRTIHTVGHSTRPLAVFIALLEAHRIHVLVDVRRWPTSRRFPHFRGEALSEALHRRGIGYVWRGDLGGYRRPEPGSVNTGWKVGSFRAYADFMLTEAFEHIFQELEALAGRHRLCLMCAEASPWRCHRQLLSDAFLVRGWDVRHITDRGCEPHRLPKFARVEGTRILYPVPD